MKTLAATLVLLPAILCAQSTDAPRLGYVYPAGGQKGTTFPATVGGQSLDGVSAIHVSGGGVRVVVGAHTKPPAPREVARLRERLGELRREPGTPAVREEIAVLQETLAAAARRATPALAERVALTVTVAPDAAPGDRELRLETPRGLTSPIRFRVGSLPEILEDASVDETRIRLPATVNGQLIPAPGAPARGGRPPAGLRSDVDRYRFEARRGQELVAVVAARDLIPYLADAVPGWFQATVALYDAAGRELAFEDDDSFRPDPVLHYRIPADGEYVVEIRDAVQRGRDDFVYRLSIGELPFVTGVFPLGGRPGKKTRVQLRGWNLPRPHMDVAAAKSAGVQTLSAAAGLHASNAVAFAVDAFPQRGEGEPNDDAARARRLTLPVLVDGRIDSPGEADVFLFEGRAGDVVVAEVQARRLGSALDSALALTDADGRRVAASDDHEDKGTGLLTDHADTVLTATLPAGGPYWLRLHDVRQQGGPEYAYRLRVSAPVPDFDLRVVPSSLNVRAGSTVAFAVHVLRKDGFTGDVALALKDAPRGARLDGAVVPAGQNSVRVTLTVPDESPGVPARLRVIGHASIGRHVVEREATAADDRIQAFASHHLVPARELMLCVTGTAPRRDHARPAEFLTEGPLAIPAGGTASVRLARPPGRRFAGVVRFELDDPPPGITLAQASSDGDVLVLRSEAATASGLRGNLIVTVVGERRLEPGQTSPPAGRRRVALATLPALPFEIVDR